MSLWSDFTQPIYTDQTCPIESAVPLCVTMSMLALRSLAGSDWTKVVVQFSSSKWSRTGTRALSEFRAFWHLGFGHKIELSGRMPAVPIMQNRFLSSVRLFAQDTLKKAKMEAPEWTSCHRLTGRLSYARQRLRAKVVRQAKCKQKSCVVLQKQWTKKVNLLVKSRHSTDKKQQQRNKR